MSNLISSRQEEFIRSKLARINLLEGSVRSGKTWISLVMWALFVASMPKGSEFLMVGKTLTTLKRNCLGLLQELEPGFIFTASQKKASLYGKTIWLEGANTESAENKIRGMTLSGAYVDELTLIPEGFYNMLLSRLSERDACLIATTNPDSPNHYVYKNIIENKEIDRKVTKFHITDNPFLEPEYIKSLASEYRGVFYQRYFLGEWVVAEGLVYPMFCKDNISATEQRPYTEYCVSMDYGILNPTNMQLWGYYDGVWYLVKEYYHSGRDSREQKTDEQYYHELEKLCDGLKISYVYIDPSASSFITLVRQKGRFTVYKANNDVLSGIQHVASALDNGLIKINDCCENTIREFGLYLWDDKSIKDEVIKENDHCLVGDTNVHTLFGKRKIKNLIGKFGFVWSWNEKRQKKCLRPFFGVRKTGERQPIYKITCTNGKEIRCTGNHRILTDSGWKQAKYLKASDKIIDIFEYYAEIQSIEIDDCEDVYNMEVFGTHNFAVNDGLIVHNCMDATRYFVQTRKAYKKQVRYQSVFGS